MMAGKLWSTVLLSLAFSGFFCEEVTISNNSQGTTGSPMINVTSAAKSATSMSTIATTTIKDQRSQTPHIRANETDRLEKVTEGRPKITAGTTTSTPKIPVTSAFNLGPAILVQSSQSPDNQTNTTVRLEKESEDGPKNNSGLTNQEKQDDASYIGIILPVVIALIVISVIVFLLMALYRMCLKTTPERQENGTEQAPSDKENVKLISVKTTSSDSEQTSQGRNKTRQHNDSSSCQGNKCM
ncbi:endomucin isoform X4 [Notechis scutatus]|uniref:Endomucin isoform X4 n=1 Tax=Notechis scutatus TaxID=8663 RepID=A0A6J1UBW0_9SAUR|nr:endomucin isoform X4 [Notechis scutatus]